MKGVIVAAGYGTRFLPMTKTVPKEMLPIFNKPAIDFILDEFEEAGIKDVIVITSRRKRALEDYLDREIELEWALKADNKNELLDGIKPRNLNFIFIRQPVMRGTGHALLLTKPVIGDSPFVVAYPDDLVIGEKGLTKSLIELFDKTQKSILAVREEKNNISRYGVISPEEKDGLIYMKSIVEKPESQNAPSNLVSIGRYLFTSRLLEILEKNYITHTHGEFYHIDAINELASQGEVLAYPIDGMMLDTGDPLSYFSSILTYANRFAEGRRVLGEFYKNEFNG
jgi:UTP--glucose-1-phosphate uridylyltransferase